MSYTLHIMPSGHLQLVLNEDGQVDSHMKKVIVAFTRSTSEGLFCLAAQTAGETEPSILFWREVGIRYLSRLCRIQEADADKNQVKAPEHDELHHMLVNAPPMVGAEYLNTTLVLRLWEALNQWTVNAVIASDLSLSGWLKKHAPHWHQVGRVCFHLAENQNIVW
jgi:non-specific serine/threonine protein kinase